MNITYGTFIRVGMWASKECVGWKEPMFEITNSFLNSIIDPHEDVCTIDGDSYVKCSEENYYVRSYLFANTKDELKTKILSKLYFSRDMEEAEIVLHKREIDRINNVINAVEGA